MVLRRYPSSDQPIGRGQHRLRASERRDNAGALDREGEADAAQMDD